jgi:hypothetical protein
MCDTSHVEGQFRVYNPEAVYQIRGDGKEILIAGYELDADGNIIKDGTEPRPPSDA